jgi:hypothetical protein
MNISAEKMKAMLGCVCVDLVEVFLNILTVLFYE